jgi:hypothetical protein
VGLRRSAGVAFAVSLVLVPALFTVFPEWVQLPFATRVLIVCAWIPLVWVTSRAALRQGEQLEELLGPALERRAKQKTLAARRLIEQLLKDGHPIPGYKFRLYMLDDVKNELIPVFAPVGSDAESWPVGQGVTGEAWRRGTYITVRGEATHDDTYHLSSEQQTRYAHLDVIAALPVLDDRGRPIAVLTGSGTRDAGRLVSADGYDRHQELAQVVGRILIDIVEFSQ